MLAAAELRRAQEATPDLPFRCVGRLSAALHARVSSCAGSSFAKNKDIQQNIVNPVLCFSDNELYRFTFRLLHKV